MLLTKDTLEATLELNRLAWRGLVLEIEKEYEGDSGSDDSTGGSRREGGTMNVRTDFAYEKLKLQCLPV